MDFLNHVNYFILICIPFSHNSLHKCNIISNFGSLCSYKFLIFTKPICNSDQAGIIHCSTERCDSLTDPFLSIHLYIRKDVIIYGPYQTWSLLCCSTPSLSVSMLSDALSKSINLTYFVIKCLQCVYEAATLCQVPRSVPNPCGVKYGPETNSILSWVRW